MYNLTVLFCVVYYVSLRNSDGHDIVELVHTVEVPIDPYSKCMSCRYKYSVFSDAVKEIMISPFEFISGNTKDGRIIDRILVLDAKCIKKDSKSNQSSA